VLVDGLVERILPPGEQTSVTLFERIAAFFTRRDDRTALYLIDLRPVPVPFAVQVRPGSDGRTVQTLGAGTGLVAATAFGDDEPIWVITGTDDAGVASAVLAFEEGTLAHRFALAVSKDLPVPLPVAAGKVG